MVEFRACISQLPLYVMHTSWSDFTSPLQDSPISFALPTSPQKASWSQKQLGLYLSPVYQSTKSLKFLIRKTLTCPHWNQDVLLYFLSPTTHVLTLRWKHVIYTNHLLPSLSGEAFSKIGILGISLLNFLSTTEFLTITTGWFFFNSRRLLIWFFLIH